MNPKANRQRTTRNGKTDATVKRTVLKTQKKQKHFLGGVNCFDEITNTYENKQKKYEN